MTTGLGCRGELGYRMERGARLGENKCQTQLQKPHFDQICL